MTCAPNIYGHFNGKERIICTFITFSTVKYCILSIE